MKELLLYPYFVKYSYNNPEKHSYSVNFMCRLRNNNFLREEVTLWDHFSPVFQIVLTRKYDSSTLPVPLMRT